MIAIKITKLEQLFLDSLCEDERMYLDHMEGYMKGIKVNQISGIVSSLVKKGIIWQEMDEEYNMSVIGIEEIGKQFTIWK